jgi:hypothetical protein
MVPDFFYEKVVPILKSLKTSHGRWDDCVQRSTSLSTVILHSTPSDFPNQARFLENFMTRFSLFSILITRRLK